MDTIVKIVGVLGNVALILGLIWGLLGAIKFFQSKKNNDKREMDEGLEGIVLGGILGVVAKGICSAIVAALNSITF